MCILNFIFKAELKAPVDNRTPDTVNAVYNLNFLQKNFVINLKQRISNECKTLEKINEHIYSPMITNKDFAS